jgi:hypothetical protein
MRALERQFLRCQKPKSLVFIFSVIVTLSFWSILPPHFQTSESSDYSDYYEPVARNILNGAGITNEDGTPAINYPPGYPLLLAAIFAIANFFNVTEKIMLSGFALMCMGTASVFVFMLASTIWRVFPALISSLLWITYPLSLWVTKQPNSELPFLVFFYAGFYLFWHSVAHKNWTFTLYFFSGALIGLSILIRPITIGAVFIMSAALYFLAKEIKPPSRLLLIAGLLIGNIIAISPWETWTYLQTRRIIPLSAAGPGSVLDGLTFAIAEKGYRQTIKVPLDVVKVMEDIQLASSGSATNNRLRGAMTALGKELITQPSVVVRLYAIKAARSWYATDSGRFETAIILFQIPYLLLIVLGSVAAWSRRGIFRDSTIVIWLIVLYFWAMTTTVLSIVRYMVPVIGLLLVLAPAILERQLKRAS